MTIMRYVQSDPYEVNKVETRVDKVDRKYPHDLTSLGVRIVPSSKLKYTSIPTNKNNTQAKAFKSFTELQAKTQHIHNHKPQHKSLVDSFHSTPLIPSSPSSKQSLYTHKTPPPLQRNTTQHQHQPANPLKAPQVQTLCSHLKIYNSQPSQMALKQAQTES